MEVNRSVTAFAPATVANISCGFDIMGFALEGIGDNVTVEIDNSVKGRTLEVKGRYAENVPSCPEKNTAVVGLEAMLKAAGKENLNLRVILEKNLPVGSGLGSSASSSAAAVFALNRLLGNLYETKDLVKYAMEGERAASGTAHADNAAPSLLGGFVLIRSYEPLDIVSLRPPAELYCAVIYPHIEIKTYDARRVLKKEFPLNIVTRQSANTAALMAGLLTGDFDLIGRSMNDLLAEPRRTMLIPGFVNARKEALGAGAIGCGISGSGPSVFAFCRNKDEAEKIAQVMQKSFSEAGLQSDKIISSLNAPGAQIINEI